MASGNWKLITPFAREMRQKGWSDRQILAEYRTRQRRRTARKRAPLMERERTIVSQRESRAPAAASKRSAPGGLERMLDVAVPIAIGVAGLATVIYLLRKRPPPTQLVQQVQPPPQPTLTAFTGNVLLDAYGRPLYYMR